MCSTNLTDPFSHYISKEVYDELQKSHIQKKTGFNINWSSGVHCVYVPVRDSFPWVPCNVSSSS